MTYMRTLVIRREQPFFMDMAYLANFCAHERTWTRFRTDPPVIRGAGSKARHTQELEVLILCAVRLESPLQIEPPVDRYASPHDIEARRRSHAHDARRTSHDAHAPATTDGRRTSRRTPATWSAHLF